MQRLYHRTSPVKTHTPDTGNTPSDKTLHNDLIEALLDRRTEKQKSPTN